MAERVLYHYTSAGGLLGIIESGTLWASDCRFLNDATELSYSTEQLLAALSTLEDDTMGPESGFILPGVVEHLTAETFRVHVVCFCEDGDLLSQWRAYGADGGYAVGFGSDRLWNSEPQAILIQNRELVRVVYGFDAVRANLEARAREIAERRTGHPGANAHNETKSLMPLLAGIKHPAFSEEREWRLVTTRYVPPYQPTEPDTALKVRVSQVGFVPYYEIPFPSHAVREIVIGPGRHAEERVDGVKQLLNARAMREVQVRVSAVPLRA